MPYNPATGLYTAGKWNRRNRRTVGVNTEWVAKKVVAAPTDQAKLKQLIKRVTQSEIETKQHALGYDPYLVVVPTGGSWSASFNLLADIPNLKNVTPAAATTENSYIGEQIHVKGVKIRFSVTYASSVPYEQLWRLTVVSTTKTADMANIYGAATPSVWFAGDSYNTSLPPVRRRWNTDRVTVLQTKHAKVTFNDTLAGVLYVDMWVPINRKCNRDSDDSVVTNNYWGNNKGLNYYLVIDGYQMGSANINASGAMSFGKIVYFKDA